MFSDRTEAGKKLAELLSEYSGTRCTVYALPRGGLPVGFEVSVKLGLPLDVLIVKKIGAPYQEELAMGAVTEGKPPTVHFNQEVLRYEGLNEKTAQPYVDRKLKEIDEIKHFYRNGDEIHLDPESTAIIVDDGVATGATVKVAVRFFREHGYRRIVVAVPVAHRTVIDELEKLADRVHCVDKVQYMSAVGEFYSDFSPITHQKARDLLMSARRAAEN